MKFKRVLTGMIGLSLVLGLATGCSDDTPGSRKDAINTLEVGNKLQGNQPTPTDINYSLERFNHIRRAYWVNGEREKAMALTVPIQRPLGYVVLFSDNGSVIGRFIVEGKVSSLVNYLTPISTGYATGSTYTISWLADTDGTYGLNSEGIFFFTPDGKYLEWTGDYLFSDIPFEVEDPILKVGN